MNIPLSPCVPENLVSQDGSSRPVPRQSAHLHTQAESGAYGLGLETGAERTTIVDIFDIIPKVIDAVIHLKVLLILDIEQ